MQMYEAIDLLNVSLGLS